MAFVGVVSGFVVSENKEYSDAGEYRPTTSSLFTEDSPAEEMIT